jgi:hypothetical protein
VNSIGLDSANEHKDARKRPKFHEKAQIHARRSNLHINKMIVQGVAGVVGRDCSSAVAGEPGDVFDGVDLRSFPADGFGLEVAVTFRTD